MSEREQPVFIDALSDGPDIIFQCLEKYFLLGLEVFLYLLHLKKLFPIQVYVALDESFVRNASFIL